VLRWARLLFSLRYHASGVNRYCSVCVYVTLEPAVRVYSVDSAVHMTGAGGAGAGTDYVTTGSVAFREGCCGVLRVRRHPARAAARLCASGGRARDVLGARP